MSVEYTRGREIVTALHNVDLDIESGGVIGLSGVSGSGKSTLARCIAGWQNPSAGSIERFGRVQLVMQDPGASLNPRFTAFKIMEEPLRLAAVSGDHARRIDELLDLTGISRGAAGKRASQFSGGERARLAIARALAAIPENLPSLLILDESLASLDTATRDSILQRLSEVQRKLALTYLLISHDRELLRGWADRVLEMNRGRLA